MFGDIGLLALAAKGGVTVLVLAVISVVALAVIIEKYWLLTRLDRENNRVIEQLIKAVEEEGDRHECRQIMEKSRGDLAACLRRGMARATGGRETMLRAIDQAVMVYEKRLPILGTTGAVTPFIGLFGTVLGIMRAFHDIGQFGTGNPAIVASGIAEALVATAAGLMVAVPAVVCYNFFTTRFERQRQRWSHIAEEVAALCLRD